jgi:hypothetical protein
MKYAAFALLALALSVSARPFGGHHGHNGHNGGNGGNGGNGNNNNSASSSAADASSTAATATAVNDDSSSSATTTASASVGTSTNPVLNGTDPDTQNNPNVQESLTLDPSVIAQGFLNDGQLVQEAGQVASLTSGNNFINFCATVPNLPITNGLQITTGSCNPAPMGIIPSTANMPSAKFQFPTNGGTVPANQNFTIALAIQGMETGHFVNAEQNYFAAPQQTNGQGQVVGHSHVVVEALSSLTQTTPTDPSTFAFFKGLNDAAVNGVLTAVVANGLPAGTYKVSTINTAANHQPILVPIAQHGSLDDVVYFTVTDNGDAASNSTLASTDTAVAATSTSTSTSTSATSTSTDTAAASSTAVGGANDAVKSNGGNKHGGHKNGH